MSIVNSVVTLNRQNGTVFDRRIKEEHTDHLDNIFKQTWDFISELDPDDYASEQDYQDAFNIEYAPTLALHATNLDSQLAQTEINEWISEIEQGRDPAHIDMGSYFINSEPNYNTWAVAINDSVVPFLQKEVPEQTKALNDISDLWSRLTNKEGEDIAGKPNDVASEIQIAIDTQSRNDAYIPLIDEEGNPRG